jgi:hypothetical protein
VPALNPLTTPATTVAVVGLLLDHTPPDVVSDRVMLEPLQMLLSPEILPITVVLLTKTDLVVLAVPQLPVVV